MDQDARDMQGGQMVTPVAQPTGENTDHQRKGNILVVVGIVVLLIIIGCVVWWKFAGHKTVVLPGATADVKPLPLETGQKVIISKYIKTAKNTAIAESYVSQSSADKNFKIFSDYFSEAPWQILYNTNDPSKKTVVARFRNQTISIMVTPMVDNKSHVVVDFETSSR